MEAHLNIGRTERPPMSTRRIPRPQPPRPGAAASPGCTAQQGTPTPTTSEQLGPTAAKHGADRPRHPSAPHHRPAPCTRRRLFHVQHEANGQRKIPANRQRQNPGQMGPKYVTARNVFCQHDQHQNRRNGVRDVTAGKRVYPERKPSIPRPLN